MELAHQLAEQLTMLEAQAAQCAALLDGADDELIEQVIAAFAPLPAVKGSSAATRATWARTWIAWIAECGDRYEQRPTEPSADDLHRVLIRWAQR